MRMTLCGCVASSISAISMAMAGLAAPAKAQVGPPGLIADLVTANHILYDQGVVDGFGHVSVRNPANPERFFLSRARAPSMVEAADIMEFDLDGKPTGGPRDKPVFQELYIHAEVFRARPDVNGVVHSHSPAVVPFGVVKTPFRPVSQTGSFLCGGVPNFDLRDDFPDAPNLLVTSSAKGASLAKKLGDRPVALMRGHGDTVAGASLKEAVYLAIFTEVAAKLTTQAIALAQGGPVIYIGDHECERNLPSSRSKGASEGIDRNWEIWAAEAAAHRGGR
jgi:HCOMODA/2-hydroxy-3-carboxy-muconic semialdehyde decarboxylase